MKKTDEQHKLLGLNLFGKQKTQLLKILRPILTTEPTKNTPTTTIFTPNPEQVVQAKHSKSFGLTLEKADFLLPDGVGLLWASRVLSLFGKTSPIKERITGTDVVLDLLTVAAKHNLKVLIVGGRGYKPFLENFQAKNKDFEHVFWTPGYEDVKHQTKSEEVALKKTLAEVKPALVLVAFGAPDQEEWIISHLEEMKKTGVRIAMAVGGALDMIFDITPRAPLWMQKLGLEWLFRLVMQPWRWRRQLRLLEFIKLTIQEIFR